MGNLQGLLDSAKYMQQRQAEQMTKSEQVDKLIAKQNKPFEQAENKAINTIDYIKTNEGFRPGIYDDTKGIKTGGFGFNYEDPVMRSFIPEDILSGKRQWGEGEANEVFDRRMELATKDAITYMGGGQNYGKLSDSQKKGLLDMSYNMGLTRLNGFGELRKALFLGDKLKAKEEVLDSKYAREDVPGRALKNANLMLK